MSLIGASIPLVQGVECLPARAKGKRVLHLGCTNAPYTAQSLADGSLLHLRLGDVAGELHGEPVHPDHVAYYSQATLARLLTAEGLVVTGQWFYDLGTEHLPYTRWPVRWTNAVLTRLAPQLADGVIAECRTADPLVQT